ANTKKKEHAEASKSEALRIVTQAAELSSTNGPVAALAWWSKGNVLSLLEQDEEALLAYERASNYKPDLVQIHLSLGETLDRLQDHEGAAKAFADAEAAADTPEDKSEAYRGEGRAQHRLERYEEALQACRKAIDANGENEKI